jgi:hypothetical protein
MDFIVQRLPLPYTSILINRRYRLVRACTSSSRTWSSIVELNQDDAKLAKLTLRTMLQLARWDRRSGMVLGILGFLVVICVVVTQLLLIPLNLASAFHLPHLLWLDSLPTWFGIGIVLGVGAWIVGDR